MPLGTTANASLQTRKWTRKSTENVKTNPHTRRRKGAKQKCERAESRGRKNDSQRKSARGCGRNLELGGGHDANRSVIAQKRMLEDRGALPREEGHLIG